MCLRNFHGISSQFYRLDQIRFHRFHLFALRMNRVPDSYPILTYQLAYSHDLKQRLLKFSINIYQINKGSRNVLIVYFNIGSRSEYGQKQNLRVNNCKTHEIFGEILMRTTLDFYSKVRSSTGENGAHFWGAHLEVPQYIYGQFVVVYGYENCEYMIILVILIQ